MATKSPVTIILDETAASPPRRLFLETLHEWVTTVDHKKIGLMYIGYALFFLLVAGFEAILIRIQLAIPNNTFVSPQIFNRLFTMHGTTMVFFVGMPILFGFGNYLVPLMIGARDMAFPRLNAFSFWVSAFGGTLLYFSYLGGDGLYGAGSAPDIGWFAYAPLTARCLLPRSQHRLLDPCCPPQRHRKHWNRTQHRRHHYLHALPRHEAQPDAPPGVALSRHLNDGLRRGQPPHRGADHASPRPLSRLALLRYSGRRLGGPLDALLLDLRSPRGLYPCAARFRLRERDHPRLLP